MRNCTGMEQVIEAMATQAARAEVRT